MCQRELGDMDFVSIVGFEREYLDGLLEVAARREDGEHLLVLFLGSTIGNFERPAGVSFLREVRRILRKGRFVIAGNGPGEASAAASERLRRPARCVTAAFNLNLLKRINRELAGDFDLEQFQHEARFNSQMRSVEMHLRSRRNQTVTVPGAGFAVHFRGNETIWTESSHKYTLAEVVQTAEQSGFRCKKPVAGCSVGRLRKVC